MKRTGIGKYNRRGTIQQGGGPAQDEATGLTVEGGWVDFLENVPASIQPLSGREYVAAGATQSNITTRIEIPFAEGITPKMRFLDDAGQPYGIEVVLPDDDTGRDHLTLVCTTEQP